MKSSAVGRHGAVAGSRAPTSVRAAPARASIGLALMTVCGILSPATYVAADVIAARRYPGFSYTDQAVSELFAIGAPTHALVVAWFSVSSVLLLCFAIGLWLVSRGQGRRRFLAVMLACTAINGLVLWTAFPMHMRGAERTLTDAMHLALAANPFWVVSLIMGAVAFRNGFRTYSIVMLCVLLMLSWYGFSYAAALATNGPTPWMGLTERLAQYLDGLWQAVLALVIWREHASRAPGRPA